MVRRKLERVLSLIFMGACLAGLHLPGCASRETVLPGPRSDGRVHLPNNWILSPAGHQVDIGDLPLNLDMTPDGKYIATTNNGAGLQSISIVETSSWNVVSTTPVAKSWLGLQFYDSGTKLAVSGGNDNCIYLYSFDAGMLSRIDSIPVGAPLPAQKIWVGGIDISNDDVLYACTREDNSLVVVDLRTRASTQRIQLDDKPYTCLVSPSHDLLYVSLWGGGRIVFVDRTSLRILRSIPVGDHPNDMVESPDGRRLFVANANHNTVSVVDIDNGIVVETLTSSVLPNLPPGSTPNSVALNRDGTRLYIANADNNCLAVMDISHERQSRSLGFIPTGWYPTCVRLLPGSGMVVVANGKGNTSRANPQGPNPEFRNRANEQYIGRLLLGTLSVFQEPTQKELEAYTAQVYANSPLTRKPGGGADSSKPNPVPRVPGTTSPIKYVFYIIKENRTYDQVFGDLPQGNGDSALCLFPETVTPNHHALAREFVLLDNFYCDAEVSADGHNWSMAAYATDYTEKSWPTSYSGRGGEYEFEGGFPIVYPSGGYIWDNCRRNELTFRSYGEFAENGPTSRDSVHAVIDGLAGHVAPFYRGWDMDYSDTLRARAWMREFDEFERTGTLPRFQIIKLPNDHTEGTRRGSLTPRAFVAQNDLALGMIVDRISKSTFWMQSAIFVIEDDAQNGPDHVDAHRTVALVISPYAKRGFVDSELYSTSSMVRTIELILGLPPMSQFDASSTAMHNSFTITPTASPYTVRGARINIGERNPEGAYGQLRSAEMDFTAQDRIPDIELNEIIWKSIRGVEFAMPAPVRSAFVRLRNTDRDDD